MQNHFGIQNLWMVKNTSCYEVVGIVFCLCYEFCARK